MRSVLACFWIKLFLWPKGTSMPRGTFVAFSKIQTPFGVHNPPARPPAKYIIHTLSRDYTCTQLLAMI